jgi:ribonuclease P protein component
MSDEADLPAQQARAQAAPRLPCPVGDRGRPQGAGRAPQPRPQDLVRLNAAAKPYITLTRRADFLAANSGRRAPMPGFVLLVRARGDDDPSVRLGITVTKKIGNAVVRNRMKRRFRALARELLPACGIPGADHVLIGRAGGVERDFGLLREELRKALGKLAHRRTDTANPVRAEPVEALPSLSPAAARKDGPSTSSGRTEGVASRADANRSTP